MLTDASYKVLAAQRTYKDDSRGWAVSPGLLYPVSMIRLYERIDTEVLRSALAAAEAKFTLKSAPPDTLTPSPSTFCCSLRPVPAVPTSHRSSRRQNGGVQSEVSGCLSDIAAGDAAGGACTSSA